MDSPQQRSVRDTIIEEWVGAWVFNPESDQDRIASQLVRDSMKFTKADSFISPIAVASIDILGIKDLLARKSLEEVAEKFAEPFYDLSGPLYEFGKVPFSGKQMEQMGYRRKAGIYAVSISDTVLLMRRPDWEDGNKAIAEATAVVALAEEVCKVIKINSIYGIPLRAAIAFGECLVSVGRSRALLGLATGEADFWERQQEWIGGMLTPSATDALRRGDEAAKQIYGADFSPRYPNTLVRYSIPLKSKCAALPEPQIALNWTTGIINAGAIFYKAIVPPPPGDDLLESVRRKHQNTIAFAEHCKGVPLDAPIDWDSIPAP